MKFEQALEEMKKGKKIKLPDQDYYLMMISKIYYDGNDCRPMEILSCDGHVLREDWQIID